jgi:transposase InsO family protein
MSQLTMFARHRHAEPGKPWQSGVTESFNGKFRDECLSLEMVRSRAEAKVIHSSLDYLTPNEFGSSNKTSAPQRNGPGRCGRWGLRAR